MKKIKSILLSLFALCFLPAEAWVFGTRYEIDGLKYTITSEAMATVCVEKGDSINKISHLVIPDSVTINGKNYTVTSIDNDVFMSCDSLVSVVVPKTVKFMDEQAFGRCRNLETVYLPDGCNVSYACFYGDVNLRSVRLPSDLKELESGVFDYCYNLTDVNIPENIEEIGWYTFAGCRKLPDLELPKSLKTIGQGAFRGCESFERITVPDSVSSLPIECFKGCINLEEVNIPENSKFIFDQTFDSCLSLRKIVIPENVKVIRSGAFRDCSSLDSLTIPASVQYIYQEAFAGCWNLKKITSEAMNPPVIGDATFLDYNVPLSIPAGSEVAYKSANNWEKFFEKPMLLTIQDSEKDNGISMKVTEGQQVRLRFLPSAGWHIHSVTYNGEDMTDKLVAGYFTTPAITSGAVVNVAYEDESAGIDAAIASYNNVRVSVSGNAVSVSGNDGDTPIPVYTLQGILQTTISTVNGKACFTLPGGNCYLVKAEGKTIKIML